MATPAPDQQFDALASLEERIAKAVELMSDLRQERDIIMKDLEAAIAAKEVAERETARLHQQVETLQDHPVASSMPDDKKQVRLTIFHQTYTLLVSGDPTEIEQAAHVVDELMMSLARSRNLDATRAAVFASLHLADRVRTLEKELSQLRVDVSERSQRISSLLDSVLD